jgi:hypothetical protein
MTKKTTKDAEVKLVYIGERVNGDKLVSVFIEDGKSDREENHLLFKKGRYFIGSKYKALRTTDTTQLFSKSGLIDGDEFENEACLYKWRLESQAAIAHQRKYASKARVDKNPLPEHLIEGLKKAVECLGDKDKIAFLDYLIDEVVWKPQSERMNKVLMNMKFGSTRKKKKTK